MSEYSDYNHTSLSAYCDDPNTPIPAMNAVQSKDRRTLYLENMIPWESGKMDCDNDDDNDNPEDDIDKIKMLGEAWEESMDLFRDLLDEIEKKDLNKDESRDNSIGDLRIWFNNKNYDFYNAHIITIGRVDFNNIPISYSDFIGVSRLHAIIKIINNKIVVLDVGSFFGIKCLERSYDYLKQDSLPGERRTLIFERDETVKLKLGQAEIIINPIEIPDLEFYEVDPYEVDDADPE